MKAGDIVKYRLGLKLLLELGYEAANKMTEMATYEALKLEGWMWAGNEWVRK